MLILISVILALLAVILIWTFFLYQKDKNVVGAYCEIQPQKRYKTPIDEGSLEEIVERVASEKLTEKELLALVALVAKKFKFPSKAKRGETDLHFKFISEFCMNDSAHGATIVKMSSTLKAVNPNFKTKIEKAEREAVEARDLRDSKEKYEGG
jgi:hypothetical protein